MADSKIPADIRKLSFEDALEEMEEIVGRLESGQVKLDEAIEQYARGAQLKAHCQAKLKEALATQPAAIDSRELARAEREQIVSALHAVPALVAIHRVVAPANRRDPTDTERREFALHGLN